MSVAAVPRAGSDSKSSGTRAAGGGAGTQVLGQPVRGLICRLKRMEQAEQRGGQLPRSRSPPSRSCSCAPPPARATRVRPDCCPSAGRAGRRTGIRPDQWLRQTGKHFLALPEANAAAPVRLQTAAPSRSPPRAAPRQPAHCTGSLRRVQAYSIQVAPISSCTLLAPFPDSSPTSPPRR